MSEILDILNDVVSEREPTFGTTVIHLPTGKKFIAEIETNLDPFTLTSELADDPREKVRLHILQGQPQLLSKTDQIKFTFQGTTCVFMVVSGIYSPASIQNKFLCIQVTGKDQT